MFNSIQDEIKNKISENDFFLLYEYLFFLEMLYNVTLDESLLLKQHEVLKKMDLDFLMNLYTKSNIYYKTKLMDVILGSLYIRKKNNMMLDSDYKIISIIDNNQYIKETLGHLKTIDLTNKFFAKKLDIKYNFEIKGHYNYSDIFGEIEDDLYVNTHEVLIDNEFFSINKNKYYNEKFIYMTKYFDYIVDKEYVDLLGEWLMIKSNDIESEDTKKQVWNIIENYIDEKGLIHCLKYEDSDNLHASYTVLLGSVISGVWRWN